MQTWSPRPSTAIPLALAHRCATLSRAALPPSCSPSPLPRSSLSPASSESSASTRHAKCLGRGEAMRV
eukprot:54287-Rhodomonas_salina.1